MRLWLGFLAIVSAGWILFLVYVGLTEDAFEYPSFWFILIGLVAVFLTFGWLALAGMSRESRLQRLISLWLEAKEVELKRRISANKERGVGE